MSKRLITAVLVSLTLGGSGVWADSQDQHAQRQLRESFGLVVEPASRNGHEEGVTVSRVLTDSPAARAGLRAGDIITRVGSRDIEDFRDLANAIGRYQDGDRVNFYVERNGRERSMRLTPRLGRDDDEERDNQPRYGRSNGESDNDDALFPRLQQRFRRLESRLQEMDRQGQNGQLRDESSEQMRDLQRLQRRLEDLEQRVQQAQRSDRYGRSGSSSTLGVQVREWQRPDDSRQGGTAERGLKVTEIDPDSPAAEAGLRRGDIITRVDDRKVTTRQELRQVWQRLGSDQDATFDVVRGSRQMMLSIRREGGSDNMARDRRYERLQERIERLESRLREMEQNP